MYFLLKYKDTNRLNLMTYRNVCHDPFNQNKNWIAILTLKKFRDREVIRDREWLLGEVVNSINKLNNART